MAVAKLEEASLDKLLDIHQDEGRGAVGELVGSLKIIPEHELRSLIDFVVRDSECFFSLAVIGREKRSL